MKIILSRKGFDSSFGGHASLILPDGTLLSIPIPGPNDEMTYSTIEKRYCGMRLVDLMSNVYQKVLFRNEWENISENTRCHLDPDIDKDSLCRADGWRGAFGQAGSAQTVLENNGVEEGDLFLFFGWFQRCFFVNGKWHISNENSVHLLYGYMQIDQILYTHNSDVPEWLKYHPHCLERCINRKSNCIYIGTETLSWDKSLDGYGMLQFHPHNILTSEGHSRSRWALPACFKDVKISYHSKNSWKKEGYFQSAMRGQEFVIDENADISNWAKQVIQLGRVQ